MKSHKFCQEIDSLTLTLTGGRICKWFHLMTKFEANVNVPSGCRVVDKWVIFSRHLKGRHENFIGRKLDHMAMSPSNKSPYSNDAFSVNESQEIIDAYAYAQSRKVVFSRYQQKRYRPTN